MNSVHLIGNLTKDPEIGETKSGIVYCRFTIAVRRAFSGRDGERETDFFNCTAFRNTAEVIYKYMSKGKKIGVVGSIQLDNYEDKDGNKRQAVKVIASEVEFLGAKDNDSTPAPQPKPAQPRQSRLDELEPIDDGDSPF